MSVKNSTVLSSTRSRILYPKLPYTYSWPVDELSLNERVIRGHLVANHLQHSLKTIKPLHLSNFKSNNCNFPILHITTSSNVILIIFSSNRVPRADKWFSKSLLGFGHASVLPKSFSLEKKNIQALWQFFDKVIKENYSSSSLRILQPD